MKEEKTAPAPETKNDKSGRLWTTVIMCLVLFAFFKGCSGKSTTTNPSFAVMEAQLPQVV